MLARGKVKETVRLIVRVSDSSGSTEANQSGDACAYSACRAGRRERDGSPDCRAQPPVESKPHRQPQAAVTRNDEREDLFREIGARTADGAGADEFFHSKGLDMAGLPVVWLVDSDN